jgi:threonine/homoserine/homoserine lactone efflux protein
MLGIHEFWLFILSGLLLNITPGPDTAYILGRSIQLGWRGGAAAAIGISTGCLVHVFAAAIGLSALLMASSAAFAVLKLAGAAYLLFAGIQMLLSRPKPLADVAAQGGEASLSKVFWQGALTNVLNPKVALFFLAFLPQFIDAAAPHKALAFVALGAVFAVNGTLVNVAFAALIARLRGALGSLPALGRWLARGVGAVFVALGVRLAGFDGSGR